MLDKLTTESRNENTYNIDAMSIKDIVTIMNQEDSKITNVIETQISEIEKAIYLVINSFQNGGRLIYIGAGTSGRLGVLDAVECVPTFGVSPEMVQGIIAGGETAFLQAVERAEDDAEKGEKDLQKREITEADTVIGIAASGRTPYVIGALKYATKIKANTVSIACNKEAIMSKYADVAIELETGPEVITGSTRLKAGSAQKMVLNMISTAAMIGIGKVYQNLMVDLKATNKKLVDRSKRIIMDATGVSADVAEEYLQCSNNNVKIAIIMILLQCSYDEAQKRILQANGFVRKALNKEEDGK
ncbi:MULTISPECIES: N-acetylmuramic acid 6-phosphate etherase [Clostridia]|uniref:N-acetylmuramic acid 6-phosphate etherase n=1 Tax=Clostridia TaxID=186801 RepID=UPI000EA25598|nr:MULTISPECIES: N-acetylmuramic acid 6-phosphate etherase [Clostridia]NBJ68602.1 N-acetylmuramic acid 6-phosphate etherase [Roseburia sp. 1XD42-34]RKI80714.1 N-acetylmuramic acid 6-phosphate etherase [Clostridium sp. 1xD42-85]